jgi:hypothetical protein
MIMIVWKSLILNRAIAAIKFYILNQWLNENYFSVSLVGFGTDF